MEEEQDDSLPDLPEDIEDVVDIPDLPDIEADEAQAVSEVEEEVRLEEEAAAPGKMPDPDFPHIEPLPGAGVRVENPDGTSSSERTIGVNLDGKERVIPTLLGGQQFSDDDAIASARQHGLDNFPSFDTVEEATTYAQSRSEALGRQEEARVPKAPDAPFEDTQPPESEPFSLSQQEETKPSDTLPDIEDEPPQPPPAPTTFETDKAERRERYETDKTERRAKYKADKAERRAKYGMPDLDVPRADETSKPVDSDAELPEPPTDPVQMPGLGGTSTDVPGAGRSVKPIDFGQELPGSAKKGGAFFGPDNEQLKGKTKEPDSEPPQQERVRMVPESQLPAPPSVGLEGASHTSTPVGLEGVASNQRGTLPPSPDREDQALPPAGQEGHDPGTDAAGGQGLSDAINQGVDMLSQTLDELKEIKEKLSEMADQKSNSTFS